MLENNQKQSEKLYDVIQDAAAIDQEYEYQQEQIKDLISQQTEKLTEGLDDEYDALDQLESEVNTQVTKTNNNKAEVIKKDGSKDSDYDKMLNDLLN